MKLQAKPLADAFGWMNIHARHVAQSFGNRIASVSNIALVMQAVGHVHSMMDPFETAAKALKFVNNTGTSGRRWTPMPSIFPTRELKYG